MQISLGGKRVLITGATGIFGQRIAKAFAGEGALLFLTDTNANMLHDMATEKEFEQVETHLLAANFEETTEVMGLCQEVTKVWPSIDVVINNAGVYPSQLLSAMSMQDFDRVMNINVRAPFLITKEMGLWMQKTKTQGSIVNISSGAAVRGKVGHAHYSTSKAALDMLTRSFALEFAPFNIRVNGVAPGFAPGSSVSHLSPRYVDFMTQNIPLGRVSGPQDAAATILFLASDLASYVTGTTFVVDGGRSAGTFTPDDRLRLLKSQGEAE